MRRGSTVFVAGGLLLLAACTRTVVVNPAPGSVPDRGLRGSRPPPRTPPGPEPDRPAPNQPPPVRTFEVLIPPGHLPNPGECRVWIPGRAPGRQPRPRSRSCAGIEAVAPVGSWIVYRRADDPRLVYLRVIDERRPGIVIRNRIFDIDSWELVREEEPQDESRGNGRPRQERPRDDRPPENRPPVVQPPVVQPPPPPPVQPPEQRPPDAKHPEQRPPMPPREIIPPVPPPEQRPPDAKPPDPRPPEPQRPPDDKPHEHQDGPNTAVRLAIPPGHLPELGQCRVWIPGLPPGQQPKPKSRACDGIISVAPAGSWIIDRPRGQPNLVYVRLVDERRAGVLTGIRVFDIDSKRLLREETP